MLAVGFDGSSASRAALALAARLAAGAQATIRIIAVGRPTPVDMQSLPAGHASSAPAAPDLQDQLHEATQGVPSEHRPLPVFERGEPGRVLLDHAAVGVDLLLIGSSGHGRLGSALLGSTARSVLRDAPCPVVVLPPG